jgi:hypothetical protein
MHLDVRECDRSQGAVRLKFPDLQWAKRMQSTFANQENTNGWRRVRMIISGGAYQSPLARGRFGIKLGFDLAASKSCFLTQEASDCHTSVMTRLYMLKLNLN